ncbi:MAG: HAMP domain-containing histidine kinase [Pseudomonadales bacterium]|nr:HAMP domain-containing histidine kinase [Pseudomonadales bacterium]
MKQHEPQYTDAGQMRLLIVILSAAVLLPSACLLWFMTEAVRNERLATRQKLIDTYQQRMEELNAIVEDRWQKRFDGIKEKASSVPPIELFADFLGLSENGTAEKNSYCRAMVIYGQDGQPVYPIQRVSSGDTENLPSQYGQAWKLEFVQNDYPRAITLYKDLAASSQDDFARMTALMGQTRCLKKVDNFPEAIQSCQLLAYGPLPPNPTNASIALRAHAWVLLAELNRKTSPETDPTDPNYEIALRQLLTDASNYNSQLKDAHFLPMASSTRQFILNKAIELVHMEKLDETPEFQSTLNKAQKALEIEKLTAQAMEKFPNAATFQGYQSNTLNELNWAENSWAMPIRHKAHTILILQTLDDIAVDMATYGKTWRDYSACCRIINSSGNIVAGAEICPGKPFMTASLASNYPDWHIELYFTDGDVFDKAAREQSAVYLWAGLLVIIVILTAGFVAMRVVSRQIRLNKLKNDFIATVSHELKTPLASMRVLTDTLLEGRYKDQQQVEDYLRLMSKENQRLTRLIENFLTFSRMERNKQSFDILPTSPLNIVEDAIETVQTKFAQYNCQLDIDIADDLPQIEADHDAIVTVLTNLLDNGCKYTTHENKQIRLKVYQQDPWVCFAISDNGIGMTKRAMRAIFGRFYQVDQSLARHSEGCGLGLSIVKYIITAHHGTISVESKIKKGSTFTVKLPAVAGAPLPEAKL